MHSTYYNWNGRVDVQYVMSRYAIVLGAHTDYTRSPIDQRDQRATSYMCACKPNICHACHIMCTQWTERGVWTMVLQNGNTLPRCSDCRCNAMQVRNKNCLCENHAYPIIKQCKNINDHTVLALRLWESSPVLHRCADYVDYLFDLWIQDIL